MKKAVYSGKGSNVIKEAKKKNRGGGLGFDTGGAVKKARGGGVNATSSPFSSAGGGKASTHPYSSACRK